MKEYAKELLAAWDAGRIIPSISARDPTLSWNDAYAVSAEIIRLRRARGEKTVGRKIGFTNRNIWPQYQMNASIWHPVYDRTLTHATDGAATLSLKNSSQPLIEPEIAFKLRAPLPVRCKDPVRVLESIEWYAPSFEIVCCHFADWKCTPPEYAADFSLHWHLIVGTPLAAPRGLATLATQLHDCQVTQTRDGTVMDRGVGANALDHPALALAFLADIVATQPAFDPPGAGEIITTGTLTKALPVKPGETWQSRYEGLPGVQGLTLRFTD